MLAQFLWIRKKAETFYIQDVSVLHQEEHKSQQLDIEIQISYSVLTN